MPAEHALVGAQVSGARQRQVKGGPGARRVADVVDDQAQRLPLLMPFTVLKVGDCTLTGADFAAGCLLCETATMSQANPFRVFVTHAWDNSDDYLRVFEYLESANNFFYKNCSTPDHMPAGDKEALRESLRKQIAPAEVIIALPSLAEIQARAAAVSDDICPGRPQAGGVDEEFRQRCAGAQGHHRAGP